MTTDEFREGQQQWADGYRDGLFGRESSSDHPRYDQGFRRGMEVAGQ